MRHKPFEVTVDRAFEGVLDGCADRSGGTWITADLKQGYMRLHDMGWAHSLEVWNTQSRELVGGIFGLALGAAFTAESMFHRETDVSKVAFASMVELLWPTFQLFDVEVQSLHLASLGCVTVPRPEFLRRLRNALEESPEFPRR